MSTPKKTVNELAQIYCGFHKKNKELTDQKNLLELELKGMFEESGVKSVMFGSTQITYTESIRNSMPKVSEVLDLVHKQLSENPITVDISTQFMETIHEEIERNKKTNVVKTLRIKRQDF